MLPKEKVRVKEVVRIEEDDGQLAFYRAADNVLILEVKKAKAPGLDIPFKEETRDETVSLEILRKMYKDDETALEFIDRVGTTVKRYRNTHYRWIIKLSRVYTDDQMEEAIEHCVKVDKCTAYELAAYLKEVLQKEVDKREEFAVLRREKVGRLPKKEFACTNINSGIAWQIERLEELEWIEKDQNLILIGKCGCGKTSLAAHLGRKALEAGIKVSYNTFDDFLYTINNKDASDKQLRRFRYFTASSLIIIDDMMYTGVRNEDLVKFYHSIMLLNETRSIIFITNRELSSWLEATEDRHLMQTLIDRITVNSQIIRLN